MNTENITWDTVVTALITLQRDGEIDVKECSTCKRTGLVPGWETDDECPDCAGQGYYLTMSTDVADVLCHSGQDIDWHDVAKQAQQ